ncbi:hypothetical protein P168DRAFT_317783 [Aspergillus campestris IBT 28561]|uniref:Uncharacterized protein n=1 Tax=Aspergillus campestris (strain IBT 28561) TaxID=1392248 RepID=A0A2I1D4D7_ASPC2|nr:uncharacterized protein P168DRAFT_317783 [Aspergillus campestris IBT 28561]PKY04733.1 hypothetical protein P168DRAFT_317783 [Aspergillus campestris IBT 28561]
MAPKSKSDTNVDGEVTPQDAKFIVECLKSIGDDKMVNLVKVADALGYTNVASVGNRFRAVRKRYGFEQLEAKSTGMSITPKGKAKLDALAGTPTKVKPQAKGVMDDSSSDDDSFVTAKEYQSGSDNEGETKASASSAGPKKAMGGRGKDVEMRDNAQEALALAEDAGAFVKVEESAVEDEVVIKFEGAA